MSCLHQKKLTLIGFNDIVILNLMGDIMEKKDSLLMLKYMVSEGFNPNNYERILELLQSAPLSLSKDLTEYNPYLLSDKVVYSELDEYGIDGAYGYLENSEIMVPKSLYNDDHFLYSSEKRLCQKHSYGTPSIDEFRTVIFLEDSLEEKSNEIYNAIKNSLNFKSLYFGFITEMYPKINYGDQRLVYVFHQLMNQSGSYKLSYETISEENKKLYLIKKK